MPSRVILVVGASSGIGAATVRLLRARDETVIGVARSAEGLERLRSAHPGVTTHRADVLDAAAISAAVRAITDEHGRLDAVVHTAQVMAYGRVEDVPAATFERVVDTAVHGTANVARAVLPQFRLQGKGTFIAVNSLLGEIATPRMGAYDVGKWGQRGLLGVLRLEVRDVPGIQVCTVSPGAINTPIYDQAANYAGRGGFPPAPVLAPERVAAAVAALLDRPRRHVDVGPLNAVTVAGYRYLPRVYERIVGPLVDHFVFAGSSSHGNDGNVFAPITAAEAVHGRWSALGRPRRRGPR